MRQISGEILFELTNTVGDKISCPLGLTEQLIQIPCTCRSWTDCRITTLLHCRFLLGFSTCCLCFREYCFSFRLCSCWVFFSFDDTVHNIFFNRGLFFTVILIVGVLRSFWWFCCWIILLLGLPLLLLYLFLSLYSITVIVCVQRGDLKQNR